jgi:hypothetical protein
MSFSSQFHDACHVCSPSYCFYRSILEFITLTQPPINSVLKKLRVLTEYNGHEALFYWMDCKRATLIYKPREYH